MITVTEFDHTFRIYYEPLFRFAHQFVMDEDDCADIVSGAFESTWQNMSKIEVETVRQYLYMAVRNRSIDFLRRQKKERTYIAYSELMTERYVSSDHIAEHDDEVRIVNEVMDMLGPPTSDILSACYIEGKKYREVAEEMNISIAMVKKHIVKALKKIREFKKNLKQ